MDNETSAEEKVEYVTPNADQIAKFRTMKEGAFIFRRRRQPDWVDNYTLYRDKVQLNRLTQRQSVNIPLIKSTVKTLLKDVDDPPLLYFSNLDNNDQAELFYNEYWKYSAQHNQLILKDIVDKRQVMLYGRSFKFMNIINGKFIWEIVAPEDVLVDRYVDPADLDSARFVIREHIYKPLSSLLTDPKLDPAAVARISAYMSTAAGLIKAEQNQYDWVLKTKKEASLGVIDVFAPVLGETYIELNEFFVEEFNKDTKEDEIHYMVVCEDMEVLCSAPLEDIIGETSDNFWQNHYPCTTWGDETERTDFWSDGVVDGIRTINKILNAYISQKVENRTLRSFGMNWYNSSLTDEGFSPQTFEPMAWGMYPIPVPDGMKIGDVMTNIQIPDLAEVTADIEFLMGIAQQTSAATTTQEGVKEPQTVTLGEVQLALANAKERVKSMAIYYTASWEDFGLKYTKMLEAAPDLIDDVVIHRKGRLTKKNYSKKITPQMYLTNQGYKVEVKMRDDEDSENLDSLQKLQFSKSLMPTNPTLDTIIKKKSLEISHLSSTEIAEVLKADEEMMKQMALQPPMMGQPGMGGAPMPNGAPAPMAPQPLAPVQ